MEILLALGLVILLFSLLPICKAIDRKVNKETYELWDMLNVDASDFEKEMNNFDRQCIEIMRTAKSYKDVENKIPAKKILFMLCNGETPILLVTNTMICPNIGLFKDYKPISAKKGLQNTFYQLRVIGVSETGSISRNKSVTGSAVAGAIVGGAAGAVVGAISASNTNARGGNSNIWHLLYGLSYNFYIWKTG